MSEKGAIAFYKFKEKVMVYAINADMVVQMEPDYNGTRILLSDNRVFHVERDFRSVLRAINSASGRVVDLDAHEG